MDDWKKDRFKVAFENESFIVIDKSHGVLTTPARLGGDPRSCLGRELQEAMGVQIYPVHRLDFEVAGLVVFAKTPPAHRLAQSWFEQLSVQKTYEALSEVAPTAEQPWQEWRSKLVRGKRRSFEAEHGKEAITRARVMQRPGQLLWQLQPVTGRPHQLRVHMAKFASPILGDGLYSKNPGGTAIALKAVGLNFSKVGQRLGLPEELLITGLVWPPP